MYEYTSIKVMIMTSLLKNSLALNNIPVFFEILFSMYFMYVFQLRFSSNKTPINFIDSVRAISGLFIMSFAKTSGISSFLVDLWKNECLGFFHIK